MVRFSHVYGMMCAVCCVLHRVLKSCVSCQALAEGLKQNSTLTLLYLSNNNIGPEGAQAWCPVRMVSWGEREWSTAVWKWHSGNDKKAMQCSLDFQMHSSSWNLWWQVIGVFWCIWHVLMHLPYSCFSSHVSPARLWPRPCNKTPPWRAWIWSATSSALKGLRLGVWSVCWGWCHQGRGRDTAIQR